MIIHHIPTILLITNRLARCPARAKFLDFAAEMRFLGNEAENLRGLVEDGRESKRMSRQRLRKLFPPRSRSNRPSIVLFAEL